MLTRSKTKTKQQVVDKTKQKSEKKSNRSVRLTEDLLYIVNKKLRAKDKAARDETLHEFYEDPGMEPLLSPFTEVTYRKRNFPELSQTQLAVMHKVNFDWNSTAVCKLNSMSAFFETVYRAALWTKSKNYRSFLDFLSFKARYTGDQNAVAHFIQLPKDYFRPHSDCMVFGELAWKEGGIMVVEADKFALCLTIWRLKKWLVNPLKNSYPLRCGWTEWAGGMDCRCRTLLRAMWTDDRLRNFLKDQTIFDRIQYDDHPSDESFDAALNAAYMQLRRAHDEMKDYAGKLITGEEMISRSCRALNVLYASQLQKLLEKFESILSCFQHEIGQDNDDW